MKKTLTHERLFLIGVATAFFLIYSWFAFGSPEVFNSPDETANYFFTKQFKANGDFFVPEPLNNFLQNRLHPRSISYNGFSLVPQGFLGLPLLYGFLGKFLGLGFLNFFSPLLSVLGAFCFYKILKKIFNKKIAALTFIFFLMFPAFWYYSSRSFYPNTPFLSFLLIAAWAGLGGALGKSCKTYSLSLSKGRQSGSKNCPSTSSGNNFLWTKLFIFSFCFALAIAIRPVEALWVIPFAAGLAIYYRKFVDFKKIVLALLLMVVLFLPIILINWTLYGNIFETGYTLNKAVGEGGADVSVIYKFGKYILFYGFHPRAAWSNLVFVSKFFWWYSAPALAGFIIFLLGKKIKTQKVFLAVAAAAGGWLAIFYGSGVFSDNPNQELSIGDSHFRYWLPLFALAIPFAAIFWEKIAEMLKLKRLAIVPATFMLIMSFYSVYLSSGEGLVEIRKTLKKNYEIKSEVMKMAGERDIIITGRQDKFFFPDRKVLYAAGLKDAPLPEISILRSIEFFYYAVGLSADEFFKLNNYLKTYGLKLERAGIFGNEVLYKLKKLNQITA